MKRALFAPIVLLLAAAGCNHPVADAEIRALGPEDPSVPPSEYHRPGQPCLVCHGPYQGASPEMVVAGTIYGYAYTNATRDLEPIPVKDVRIELFDARATTVVDKRTTEKLPIKTNCAGNFFVTSDQWDAAFPLSVAIYCPVEGMDEELRQPMTTRISRDGSCAGCHDGNPNFKTQPDAGDPGPNQGTPGWVFCAQRGTGAPKYEKITPCPDGS
jgi:hypothetical protein